MDGLWSWINDGSHRDQDDAVHVDRSTRSTTCDSCLSSVAPCRGRGEAEAEVTVCAIERTTQLQRTPIVHNVLYSTYLELETFLTLSSRLCFCGSEAISLDTKC